MSEFGQFTPGGVCSPQKIMGGVAPATPTERLKRQKEMLVEQLARVDEAIGALEANPEVARVMDLVQRAL